MNENQHAMVGNDVSIASQYLDTFRRSQALEPEKALLLAILEDAVNLYRKFHGARDLIGRKRFREAEEWVMGGRGGWIFSFDSVCELLDLDPGYIRRGVLESMPQAAASRRRGQHRQTRRRAAA
jgi:hypothetical protein